MKKVILILSIAILVLSNLVFTYANVTRKGDNAIGDAAFSEISDIRNNSKSDIIQTETALIDLRPIQKKSTEIQPLSGEEKGVRSSPGSVTSKLVLTGSGFFNWSYPTANAISSSTVMMDYIYAKSRIYRKDVLEDSNTESENYSSFVSALSTANKTNSVSCKAYGNHVYQLEGYYDIMHETYSTDF